MWNIYHTHVGRSNKFLFLHKPSSVKSTPHSPLLFHQEDATEKYKFRDFTGSIYWHLCVPLFHFSAIWYSEMQFGVIYLETWGGTQLRIAFSTLAFHFFFFRTHTAPTSLSLHKPVPVVACVKSFKLAYGWNLSSLSCGQYFFFFFRARQHVPRMHLSRRLIVQP
jgi:hypothetical protein